jgi:hypothetical protein
MPVTPSDPVFLEKSCNLVPGLYTNNRFMLPVMQNLFMDNLPDVDWAIEQMVERAPGEYGAAELSSHRRNPVFTADFRIFEPLI